MQQLVSESQLFQQMVSELKVDEEWYVKDKKIYDKVRDREVQW